MNNKGLENTEVENGSEVFKYLFIAFVILFLGGTIWIVLNDLTYINDKTHKNFFEDKISMFIMVFLMGWTLYIKYLFPRLRASWMFAFLGFLFFVEMLGQYIERTYHLPPAGFLLHVVIEVISGTLGFHLFAKQYLKLSKRPRKKKTNN